MRRLRPDLWNLALAVVAILGATVAHGQSDSDAIRPSSEFPRYWQYRGKPLVLIGGSEDDNLFQFSDLKRHLDEIRAAGGNYIRNTMSDRPDRGHEVYAYRRLEDRRYDLDQWNDEYWQRFANLLRLASERHIIVQIELFDRFDFTDNKAPNWRRHPLNPKNNVNYTVKQSRLAIEYPKHPGANEHPFFFSVPSLDDNRRLLEIQRRFIDKLLSYSLQYGNVLYSIDNETSGRPEWGAYWADHLRRRARERGVEVQVTEMWDAWDLKQPQHRETLDHPERYDFIDISQNNHNSGQEHWENLMWARDYLEDRPRPMNNVKIYGADGGRFGNARDGCARFWRNLIGGAASARFHRPDSGIGLSELAKSHLKSARLFLSEFDLISADPDSASRRLSARGDNEAYLTVRGEDALAIYFPRGGNVTLAPPATDASWRIRWLDIGAARWRYPSLLQAGETPSLSALDQGHWICLLERQ